MIRGSGCCNVAVVGLSRSAGGSSSVLMVWGVVEGIRRYRGALFNLISGLIDVTISSREG